MKLSVLLSGIRPNNWQKLYDSIETSFSGDWEFIIVSPYESSHIRAALKETKNVRFIQDYGSPMRCYQKALVNSIGEYITWCSDDGIFLPKALDIAVESLDKNPNSVVVGKYNEGKPNPVMDNIEYYYPKKHDATNVEFVPEGCLMLMEGIVPRETMFEVGGWNAEKFEVCPMGFIDLSIRLHNKGVKFIFQEEMLFTCSHMPGMEGDHGAVHLAQTLHDVPLFKLMYSNPKSKNIVNIPLDNWEKAPERWKRRFGG